MQGKESSEQKTSGKCTAGVDVSKSWLDAHVVPDGHSLRVANDPRGYRVLMRWLQAHRVDLVVMEPTGKWHRPFHRVLHKNAFAVAIVNPRRARLFAEMMGFLAKTDRVDARMLAEMGASLSLPVKAPAPELMEALQEFVTARASAVNESTVLRNQLGAAKTAFLRRQLKTRIDQLDKYIGALEAEIERLIASDAAIARRYAILRSIPGVGPVAAATLIANLAELGNSSIKQIAALAGLAPFADQSGSRDSPRHIRGGRAAVLRVMFLCALSAKRCNTTMASLYDRLSAKGKAHKVALIAVARKLIVLANTLIAENRLWQPDPPIPA
jgi:transposase